METGNLTWEILSDQFQDVDLNSNHERDSSSIDQRTITWQPGVSLRLEGLPSVVTTDSGATQASICSRWPHLKLDRRYLRFSDSLGRGKFGWIVRGELRSEHVIVTLLKEEANRKETGEFFEEISSAAEVRFDQSVGRGENVVRLLGVSLDRLPYLMVHEHCTMGDLKTFLINGRENLLDQEHLLVRFCQDVVSGLHFLHGLNCTEFDLSARNCQMTDEMAVKVGDYGLGRLNYPNDYVAVVRGKEASQWNTQPLRWLAPEVLICICNGSFTDAHNGRLVKSATKENNIWTLGVTLWEICSFGRTPFQTVGDRDLQTTNSFQLASSLRAGPGSMDVSARLGEPMKSIINFCLAFDLKDRPACLTVQTYLNCLSESSSNSVKNVV